MDDAGFKLDDGALRTTTLRHRPLAKIPPRRWAYGHFLLFGSASVIGAVDGGGKGAIAIVMALAMITKKPLLGERVWRGGPVAVVSYEDDQEEWERRIAAACAQYQLEHVHVLQNIHFISKDFGRVTFGQTEPGESASPDGKNLIAELKAIGAALLIARQSG